MIGDEVGIRARLRQEMVGGDEDRVAEGDDGTAFPVAVADAASRADRKRADPLARRWQDEHTTPTLGDQGR